MEEQNNADKIKEDKAYLRKQLIKFFTFIIITASLALYMMIKEIQPAKYLIDLQAGWFNGDYYPKATFAVMWIYVMAVVGIILSIIVWIVNKIKGKN